MQRQGWIKVALASGMAVGSFMMSASTVNAQCASGNCGAMAGSYVPGGFSSLRGSTDSFGHMIGRQTQPLFDNYFTQGYANQATAGMYISPVGVPGWVGHTYNTYQPFYPHQYLYQHHDRYHSYYDDGRGFNRTHASYYAPPVRSAAKKFYKAIELPRY